MSRALRPRRCGDTRDLGMPEGKTTPMPECLRKIMEQACKLAPIAVVVVDAAEKHVLTGAHEAAQAGLIEPTLTGRRRISRPSAKGRDLRATPARSSRRNRMTSFPAGRPGFRNCIPKPGLPESGKKCHHEARCDIGVRQIGRPILRQYDILVQRLINRRWSQSIIKRFLKTLRRRPPG